MTAPADDVEFAVARMLALREELLAASRNEKRALELVQSTFSTACSALSVGRR